MRPQRYVFQEETRSVGREKEERKQERGEVRCFGMGMRSDAKDPQQLGQLGAGGTRAKGRVTGLTLALTVPQTRGETGALILFLTCQLISRRADQ